MDNDNAKKKKADKYIYIITIILLVINIIFLYIDRIGRIDHLSPYIPTGNVDVFDIDINCACTDKEKCEENINDYGYFPGFNHNSQRKNNSITDEKQEDIIGKVYVDDKNGDYAYHEHLNIFTNSAFQYTEKIAPGVSNTYHFVVHNSTNYNLKYNINMFETSQYQVKMRYRLKRNNEYIIGNSNKWVSAEELKTEFQPIADASSDSYSLDWKWVDDDNVNDTIAGVNMTELYKLDIKFYFEQV